MTWNFDYLIEELDEGYLLMAGENYKVACKTLEEAKKIIRKWFEDDMKDVVKS